MTELTKTALYYVEKQRGAAADGSEDILLNALMKWNGSDFIQLNKTSDLSASLDILEGKINDLGDEIDAVSATATGNTGLINGLAERLDVLEGDENTEGSVAKDIAIVKQELQNAINLKADLTALQALEGTVNDNAAANSSAFTGI